ncbi:MAG: hypothetical protein JRM79_04980 [Nitrososphaerota archaeon]|jgi:hypothetical protein|nr:hypothetical protein [Nitrososphaerota archaeon]MDG6937179.1 hypothetical protein [Nitrososphaerota archaeon]MDG6958979.1 hypothetical protein [Nitrososphaerota archaeon]MDG6961806.1 hypothetical protein [Nitrososphaerota archaeon]MDG6972422.1 hypothetical protein [Nitrososphaerota archaeon]
MNESREAEDIEKGLFEGLIEALSDKHSQLDINFQHAKMNLLGSQLGCELNGVLSVSVHMRELTEDEKRASAEKNVALMSQK